MDDSAVRIVGGDPSSHQWLLTTAIGGNYFDQWNRYVKPYWDMYAAEHGLGIAVVVDDLFTDDEPRLHGAWQKLLAPRALRDLLGREVRCALLDTDLFVSPGARNVFEEMPMGKIGVVSEVRGLPKPVAEIQNRVALLRKRFIDGNFPLNSLLNATPDQVFKWAGLPPMSDYFCSGMVIVDTQTHAVALAEAYRDRPNTEHYASIDWGEEVWLNYFVQSRDDVVWLDYEWHALWLFEVATYYPFLYATTNSEEIAGWCLASSLMRNQFVHLAGRWESAFLGSPEVTMPQVTDVANFIAEVRAHEAQEIDAVQRGRILPPS